MNRIQGDYFIGISTTPKGYVAINLFGVIFARNKYNPLRERSARHEAIHTKQIIELCGVLFYLWYGVEWLVRLIQYRDRSKAYRNISFECEAYANDLQSDYLSTRKPYAWIRYLKAN